MTFVEFKRRVEKTGKPPQVLVAEEQDKAALAQLFEDLSNRQLPRMYINLGHMVRRRLRELTPSTLPSLKAA